MLSTVDGAVDDLQSFAESGINNLQAMLAIADSGIDDLLLAILPTSDKMIGEHYLLLMGHWWLNWQCYLLLIYSGIDN